MVGHGFRVVAAPAVEPVATAPTEEPMSPPGEPEPSRLGELQQVPDLYRAEILTCDEFEREKARILDQ